MRLQILSAAMLRAALLILAFFGCNGDDNTFVTDDLPPQSVAIPCVGKFAEPDCRGSLRKKCPPGRPEIACDAECRARECEAIDLLCPCDGSECFDPEPPPEPDPLRDPSPSQFSAAAASARSPPGVVLPFRMTSP